RAERRAQHVRHGKHRDGVVVKVDLPVWSGTVRVSCVEHAENGWQAHGRISDVLNIVNQAEVTGNGRRRAMGEGSISECLSWQRSEPLIADAEVVRQP